MTLLLQVLGLALLLAGLFFSAVGVLGMLRLPDVYTRIHAAGKVSTLGLIGLLLGASCLMPELALKSLALAFFLLLSSPVASHAIALAAHRQGQPRAGAERDDLKAASELMDVQGNN